MSNKPSTLRRLTPGETREREATKLEYRELCETEPNAARRLDLCLRGHDVPPSLVEPIHDLLEQLAQVIDMRAADDAKGGVADGD